MCFGSTADIACPCVVDHGGFLLPGVFYPSVDHDGIILSGQDISTVTVTSTYALSFLIGMLNLSSGCVCE